MDYIAVKNGKIPERGIKICVTVSAVTFFLFKFQFFLEQGIFWNVTNAGGLDGNGGGMLSFPDISDLVEMMVVLVAMEEVMVVLDVEEMVDVGK